MTREEEIEAIRAKQILEDPLFKRMVADEVGAVYEELLMTRDATPEADAKRRELIERVVAVNNVAARLMAKARVLELAEAKRQRPQIV